MTAEIRAFCEQLYPRLVASLGLYTGDRYLAEELAQETLARAWRDWKKVGRMAHPEAWSYSTAFNLARSYWRRRAAEGRASARLEASPTPHEDLADREAVRVALRELSPRQRQAVILRYYLEYTYAEIADVMNCAEPSARSHVRRGLQTMRKHVDPDLVKEALNVT